MNWDNAGLTRLPPGRLHELLTATLEAGEEVVWFGQPSARRWRRKAYVAVPGGFIYLAFAVEVARWFSGGWDWFVGALIALPALLLLLMPWLMHTSAVSTLYVITSRRALILSAADRNMPRSYPVLQLPQMEMRPRVDGSGDLMLETEHYTDVEGDQQTREHGFEDIDDVGLARQILEDLSRGKELALVRRHASAWRLT